LKRLPYALLLMAINGACAFGQSQFSVPSITDGMAITQHLGATVPKDVPFLDEQGRKVTLGSYLGKEPVLLVPIFYSCQTGCAMITDSLVQTLMKANQPTGLYGYLEKNNTDHPLTPGKDLEVVMLGIDPRENPALAANKKNMILDTMDNRANSGITKLMGTRSPGLSQTMDGHLHLLTGTLANIRKVTDAIGFKYYFNPHTGVIRHPTGSVILTPTGVISGYTIGNDFPTKMLESSLTLAAQNQVSPQQADESFMFGCVMLDPATGHIGFVVENIVRVACVLTLIIFGFGIYRMLRDERKASKLAGGRLDGASRSN
jgi:protein SCO1/2